MTDQLSTSAILIGALVLGFVLYLAKQNRLGVYYGLMFGSSASSSGTSTSSLDPTSPNFDPAGAGAAAGTAVRNWLKGLFGY